MELAEFINKSISGREYSKYIFSRNIYLFLNLKSWAIKKNINLDDINYIDKKIINLLLKKKLIRKNFIRQIRLNKQRYNLSNNLNLPDLITSPKDLCLFEEINSKPTYIGENCSSSVINFSKNIRNLDKYKNKIVLILMLILDLSFYFTLVLKVLSQNMGVQIHIWQ